MVNTALAAVMGTELALMVTAKRVMAAAHMALVVVMDMELAQMVMAKQVMAAARTAQAQMDTVWAQAVLD